MMAPENRLTLFGIMPNTPASEFRRRGGIYRA